MKFIAFLFVLLVPIICFGQFSGKKILSEIDIYEPYCIDAADIDNDGDKDIIVCGYDETKLVWFENLGNSTFNMKQVIYTSTADAGYCVKLCDVNNDYSIDIIFGTVNKNIIFINDGHGNFSSHLLSSNSGNPYYINTGDFDNDNDMDVCLSGYDKIKWYKNIGNGYYNQAGQTTPLFNSFNPIEIFDINNDNFNDVVVLYNTDHTVSWLPNNTAGGFDNQIEICNQDSLSNFQCGDVDSDGDIDIMGAYVTGNKIKLYKNDGNGNFTDTIISILSDGFMPCISLNDLNNDNIIDLIAYQNNGFYWYENDGNGNFYNKQIIDYRIDGPQHIYVDDINSDGYNDILYATSYINSVQWFENLQDGHFSKRKILAANAERAYHITTGNIDNDNDVDILVTAMSGTIAIHRNLGFGHFSNQEFVSSLGYNCIMSDLSDIDNDGDNDVISCSLNGRVEIFENDGNGFFDTTGYIVDTIEGNWFLQVFDVDGDNDNDIFGVTDYGNYFRWIENDGTGTFTNHHLITDTVGLQNSKSIHVLDYDDDGDFDFVADLSLDSTSLFLNDGTGNFTRRGLQGILSYESYESIHLADLDNDGDKDLIGGEFSGTFWHENLGNYVFSASHSIPSKMRVSCVSAADIDGDGLKDIVSSTSFSYPDSIFWNKNLGAGVFSERLPISQENDQEAKFFTIEDIDSDGDYDVLAAIWGDDQFAYYQNCYYSRFKIKGNVFYDENQNGIKDTNDTMFLDIPIILSPGYLANLNTGETYILAVDTGSYSVSFNPNPLWNLTTPYSTYNIDINLSNPTVDTCDFGFYPASMQEEIEANLISGDNRCDFNVNYWINIENTGTQISNGIIELQLDDIISFVNSDIPPDSVIGNSIYWHYENLSFFENVQITLVVHMPDFNYMGETMTSFLNIYSLDSFGNIVAEYNDTLSEVLECSYDPNDKTGFPIGLGNEYYIEKDQVLKYVIRFQNTGNAEAINVMIRDLISENLDYTTIDIIASSSPVSVVLEYDKELVFRFDSIMLPDINTSEINSHGFVAYSISPIADLAPNTSIENTAEIYFDYNPPIITNTTLHTIECWDGPPVPVIYDSLGVLYIHSNETVYWYLNDILLFGELDTLLIPQDFGQYSVEVINQYGCNAFSAPYDIINSINTANEKIEIYVYPNPFFNKTNILCPLNESSNWNIELYNITGSKIFTVKNIHENNYELDMTGYERGIYFGKITTDDGKTGVFKLVIN